MSQDRPSLDDILATVREFLDRVSVKLSGEERYHAQVASYLLAMAEREAKSGAVLDTEEHRRMASFLGREASLDELDQLLCDRIRSGACDASWDATLALVLQQTVDKVRIVRPDHLAAMHRAAP